ncbi:FAD-dependent oxidoreductase [Salinifilum ghardaiensis]
MPATPLPAGSLRATSLNAARRRREVVEAAEGTADVLVVGGGTTGAACALDAAARGLRVTLVEQGDLASGASGLLGDTADPSEVLSAEPGRGWAPIGEPHPWRLPAAAAVRAAARRSAVHPLRDPLAHPLRAVGRVLPLTGEVPRHREASWAAQLHARDAVLRGTGRAALPRSRRLSRAGALALVPGLRADARGGLLWFAARPVDETRLVVALARTAAGFGARVLTRVRAERVHPGGAAAVDVSAGGALQLRARAVVNASGGWVSEVDSTAAVPLFRRHGLLVDAEALGIAETGLLAPVSGDGRFVSAVPSADGGAWLEPCDFPLAEEPALPGTIDAAVAALAGVLAHPPGRGAVLGAATAPVAGSPAGRAESGAWCAESGVIAAPGGAAPVRERASAAIDLAVRHGELHAGPSRTAAVPLVGSAPPAYLAESGASPRLLAKYGAEAARLAALAELDPDLADPVAPGVPVTAAEVVWAVRHEGALRSDDVLRRRAGSGLGPDQRERAHPAVEDLVRRAREGVDG